MTMRKVDRIRMLLDQDLAPREIAKQVPCAMSLVYSVRGRRELAHLKHEIAKVQLELAEISERLCRLEGQPANIVERMVARDAKH